MPPSCPQLELTAGKRTLESRLGFPERPKKPLSPYFRFMSEVRPAVTAAHPQLRLPDVVKAIAHKWETVDEAKKIELLAAFKRDQVVYLQKRAAWEAALTDDQRFQLKDLKQQLADTKERSAEKKRVRQLGRPKRASSPFLCWLNEARERMPRKTGETFREWQKRSAGVWQALTEDAKRPFYERSQSDFARYNDELLRWEEKMVRQGNVDLVRSHMLLEPVESKKPKTRKAPRAGKVEATPPAIKPTTTTE